MAPPSCSKINKEDKVGVVLGLLRAVERRHPNGIRKWAERLPDFDGAINYKDPDTWSETNKRKLRQLAHQLAKDQVVEELRQDQTNDKSGEAGDNEGADDEDDFSEPKAKKRSQLLKRLAQLCPGRGGNVGAIVNSRGEVVTDPEEMAEAQRTHWEDIFKSRITDAKKATQWLTEEKGKGKKGMHHQVLTAGDDKWAIRPRHAKRALDLAGRSAPGPDGIPFSAYKRLGLLSQNVLYHALIDLTKEGA